jgi:GTP-binding protein HflX
VEIRDEPGAWPVDDSLDELALLARTAGVEVVGEFTQTLDHPNVTFFIGPGKVEEIKAYKGAEPFDLIIFDDDLSPSQQRNLERELRTRVIDRRSLILDIFAQHARTREGALQVEVAQYEYLLPRLTRAWTHLSRQTRGGVGLRGPGETQLEIDRRRMRARLTHLRRELEEVRRHRALYRGRRRKSGIPIVAIVGYTNAGKSTLLNRVSGSNVLEADQLFATLDPTTRRVRLPGGTEVLFTDTVGFVQKLPPDLVAAFRATLEEITDADIILHVVDITHPHVQRQVDVVDTTLRELGVQETPVVVALNKIDLLPEEEAERARHESGGRIVAVSARTGEGVEALLTTIAEVLGEHGKTIRALIPYDHQALLSAVHRSGTVHQQQHLSGGTLVVASVPLNLAGQLEPYLCDGGSGAECPDDVGAQTAGAASP